MFASQKASAIRRKQYILLGALILVIVLGATMFSVFTGPAKQEQQAKAAPPVKKAFGAPAESIAKQDMWRVDEGARVTRIEEDQKKVLEAVRQMAEQLAAADKKRQDERDAQHLAAKNATARPNLPPPPKTNGAPDGFDENAPRDLDGLSTPQVQIKGIVRVSVSDEKEDALNPKAVVAPTKLGERYVPSGSFVRAINLAGLDAPTGGQVQQNPHPVLFRVTDFANLPNRFKADVKECFVTANGYGDLSSERAFIRLDRLSCITRQGQAIDIEVKGYAVGEDGKNGMRGRLVTKQGAVLMNSLLAGIASGIGNAFVQSNTVSSISPLGSTQTIEEGQEWKAGVAEGFGSALDRLSKYYIDLAEKMFPVVEVDAGREVDLVFLQGFKTAEGL